MELGSVNAVGVWFYSLSTKRYLYLLRNDAKHPGCWGLPGGKAEHNESLLEALQRECCEEIGQWPEYQRLIPLERFTSADGNFTYNTFFCAIQNEFVPKLNNEHLGYAWIDHDTNPKPLHPGLWSTISFESVKSKIEIIQQQIHTSQ